MPPSTYRRAPSQIVATGNGQRRMIGVRALASPSVARRRCNAARRLARRSLARSALRDQPQPLAHSDPRNTPTRRKRERELDRPLGFFDMSSRFDVQTNERSPRRASKPFVRNVSLCRRFANGCNNSRHCRAHGKEGVDGSSPSESYAKSPQIGRFFFRQNLHDYQRAVGMQPFMEPPGLERSSEPRETVGLAPLNRRVGAKKAPAP